MAELELIDNDVLFKVACFDLGEALAEDFRDASPVRLGVAVFVLRSKVRRSSKLRDKDGAEGRLNAIWHWAIEIEPASGELELAAEIEGIAQAHNLSFDSGESLLLAILIKRGRGRLHTGDKRAIAVMPKIIQLVGEEKSLAGRVRCFEQILLSLLARLGAHELTRGVCSEPDIDKSSAICCNCASGAQPDAEAIAEGLQSYVEELRGRCGELLIA